MSLLQGIIIVVTAFHLFTAIRCVRTINRTAVFSSRQKNIHRVLAFLIPFIWSLIINEMTQKTPGSNEIEEKNDVSSNNWYESGIGGHTGRSI